MEVIWSEHSKADLQNFVDNIHKGTEKSASTYITSLIDYVSILKYNPYIRTIFRKLKLLRVRQSIYKKHKILYIVYHDYILILAVIHNSRNMDNFYKNFIKIFSNLFI